MSDADQKRLVLAYRWFTEGWTVDIDLADTLFSTDLVTNGVPVGIEGPKTRIRERLIGFPDLTTSVERLVAADDTVAIHLMWSGTHTGAYGGVEPTGRRVTISDLALWRFDGDLVVEIRTLQDQFGLLKQIGYLPDSVRAA
ncbi:ester cyclase [Nocardia sp. alder85J]|uniref:ester cyclase n=1 Tax=Nocardia sp. alder85J TaxID=2862949 RepID=UPI001CD50949|nr:ester cyclase [Nocardia sp. alder85J]MCX4098532.1 ester cyclase [Nocardia sp. alder85J]